MPTGSTVEVDFTEEDSMVVVGEVAVGAEAVGEAGMVVDGIAVIGAVGEDTIQ